MFPLSFEVVKFDKIWYSIKSTDAIHNDIKNWAQSDFAVKQKVHKFDHMKMKHVDKFLGVDKYIFHNFLLSWVLVMHFPPDAISP